MLDAASGVARHEAAEIHTLYSDAHGPLVEKQNELVECPPPEAQRPRLSLFESEYQRLARRAHAARRSCDARVNQLQTILTQSQTDIDRYGETFREHIERMRSRLEQETRENIAEIVATISAAESVNERWDIFTLISCPPLSSLTLLCDTLRR